MTVLSIDLASRRYRDFGIALLDPGEHELSFPKPGDLGFEDPPDARSCAALLDKYCHENSVSVLLLDGPQGWRHPVSSIEHMRLAERVLNTPGKSGTPGNAKPKTYLRYIQFSVDLFHELHFRYRWSLIQTNWHRRRKRRWVIESFPSAAWDLLGLDRLPGKSRATTADINRSAKQLATVTGYEIPKGLTHDELQATVVLPVGEAVANRNPDGVIMAGFDPIIDKQTNVLEGWIVEPRLGKV